MGPHRQRRPPLLVRLAQRRGARAARRSTPTASARRRSPCSRATTRSSPASTTRRACRLATQPVALPPLRRRRRDHRADGDARAPRARDVVARRADRRVPPPRRPAVPADAKHPATVRLLRNFVAHSSAILTGELPSATRRATLTEMAAREAQYSDLLRQLVKSLAAGGGERPSSLLRRLRRPLRAHPPRLRLRLGLAGRPPPPPRGGVGAAGEQPARQPRRHRRRRRAPAAVVGAVDAVVDGGRVVGGGERGDDAAGSAAASFRVAPSSALTYSPVAPRLRPPPTSPTSAARHGVGGAGEAPSTQCAHLKGPRPVSRAPTAAAPARRAPLARRPAGSSRETRRVRRRRARRAGGTCRNPPPMRGPTATTRRRRRRRKRRRRRAAGGRERARRPRAGRGRSTFRTGAVRGGEPRARVAAKYVTTSGPYTGVVERQQMADQAMTDGSIHTRVFRPGGLWRKDAGDMKLEARRDATTRRRTHRSRREPDAERPHACTGTRSRSRTCTCER